MHFIDTKLVADLNQAMNRSKRARNGQEMDTSQPGEQMVQTCVVIGECPCVATGTYNNMITYIQNVSYIVIRKCFIIHL